MLGEIEESQNKKSSQKVNIEKTFGRLFMHSELLDDLYLVSLENILYLLKFVFYEIIPF